MRQRDGLPPASKTKPSFSPPSPVSEKSQAIRFGDPALDQTLFELAPKTAGTLVQTRFNGTECYVGKVRFLGPESFWQVFNPFARFTDRFGNRFFLSGLPGFLVAMHSVRLKQAVDVVCLKRENGFEVVRFGVLDPFEAQSPRCQDCREEHEFCACRIEPVQAERMVRTLRLALRG